LQRILKSKRVLLVAMNLSLGFRVAMIMRRMGVRPYVLGPQGHKSLFAGGLFCRRYIGFDPAALGYDADPVMAAMSARFMDVLNETCARHAIDVVLPVDNTMTLTIARYRSLLSPAVALTPIPDADMLRRLHDKWAFAQLLAKLNLPRPATRLIAAERDVNAIDLPYPLIVKPSTHGGSLSVQRVHDAAEARAHVRAHLAHYPDERMIAQEYIEGEDFQVFVLAQAGEVRAWSMCAMRKHGVRAFLEVPEVLHYCTRLIRHTGYEGTVQFDLMHDRARGVFYFLEANLRFPSSTYYHYQAGVNYIGLSLLAALGHDIADYFRPATPRVIEQSLLDGTLARGNDLLIARS